MEFCGIGNEDALLRRLARRPDLEQFEQMPGIDDVALGEALQEFARKMGRCPLPRKGMLTIPPVASSSAPTKTRIVRDVREKKDGGCGANFARGLA